MNSGTNKPTDLFEVILWVLAATVVGLLIAHYGFGYFPPADRGY